MFLEALQKALVGLGDYYAEDKNERTKQIICIRDDLCFIWSHKESLLLVVSADDSTVTKVIPTDTPLFDVEKITLSCSGRWICLWGSRGATAMEIPRRSGKSRKFIGVESDGSVVAHSMPIAERFFMCNPKIMLQQADWHPGSPFDGHLIVLTGDNHLRIFNLDSEQDANLGPGVHPEETLMLSGTPCQKRFFGESAISVRGSLGETAVSFAFAPPVNDNGKDPSPNLWPIFILCGDGSVYCMVTGLGQHRPQKPRVMGPLPMLPEASDNYGNEACAILCLHPMISSPPILVIASTSGTLYHCVVLHKIEDDDAIETASQISEWSSAFEEEAVKVDLALHVYESVELELSLVSSSTQSQSPFDYPLLLQVDPTSPCRYFVSHKAGVHSISLPMVAQLAELVQRPQETLSTAGMPIMEQNSMVEHLVCTQLLSKSSPSPVLGLAVSFPPPRLHCILCDHSLATISLSRPILGEPQPLLAASSSTSPVKANFGHKESFDKHIAQTLVRNTSNPLMRAPASANMTSQECYEILTRSTKVLREEYLDKQEKARKEIERKVAGLETRKTQQHLTLSKLAQERFALRDKAAQLSERYEDQRDFGENLTTRIEAVLNAIQRRLPVTSDAEIRMQRQLQGVERKVKDLSNALEQIKAKERYQMRQIKHSEQNVKTRREVSSEMGQNQIDSMKEVLREDGEQIAKMVAALNKYKKEAE